jgi:hypothetical protein
MRSKPSLPSVGSGCPDVHVTPGFAAGSACTARYESVKPLSESSLLKNRSILYLDVGLDLFAASGWSRCDGALKLPVRNTGTLSDANAGSTVAIGFSIAIRCTAVSIAALSSTGLDPGRSAGSWVFAIATTRPAATSAYAKATPLYCMGNSGKRETR